MNAALSGLLIGTAAAALLAAYAWGLCIALEPGAWRSRARRIAVWRRAGGPLTGCLAAVLGTAAALTWAITAATDWPAQAAETTGTEMPAVIAVLWSTGALLIRNWHKDARGAEPEARSRKT